MSELDDLKVIVEANQQYNLTEHTEIHEAIDFERIQRIAGDAVVLGQLDTVNVRITTVSSALGNEVIARTLGDQVSDGLYAGLSNRFITEWEDLTSQLSDLSIDTANAVTKLQNDIKAVDLKVDVMTVTLRNEAQALFTQYDDRLEELDQRVAKYEVMLQDITMDSSRITMDNGEIELGAWTILSQAREWDLEIIRDMQKYQLDTSEGLNTALEELQANLPNEQGIINKAIEQLSNSPIVNQLDSLLQGAITDINGLTDSLGNEVLNRQRALINQAAETAEKLKHESDALAQKVLEEAAERVDAITREADIRALQIEGINSSISEETAVRIEEIRLLNDGLTAEVNSRVEGDQNITTSLDNYKESNDTALANVRNTVEVLVSDSTALSQTVSSLDARLTVTEASTATANSLAASANEKATTALTATTSLAERMESVEASVETVEGDLTNKVDVVAFNSLKTEVTVIDGKVIANTANIASITGNITDISSQLTANTTAISELSTKQTQQGNDIEQVSSQITQLSADIDSVQNAVANKADASAVASLTSQVNQQGENITLINSDITTLKGSVSTVEGNLASKADVTAFNALDSKVTTVDGKVTALNSNVISLESRVVTAEAGIATKADASALNDIYTKTESDQAIAGQITTFESSLALGGGWMDIGREGAQPTIEKGAGTIEVIDRTLNHFKNTATSDGELSAYIGACNNSSSIPVGTPYVMTGKIRASRANLYDRIYARFNQHSSESHIYGLNASSDWVTFKASGVTNTQDQHPVYNIIGAYTPNAIAGDWVEFKDCRIAVNSDSVTAANSQAIRNTETAIATVDGKVTAQAADILNLNTNLTNLNNSKLDASIIQQYRTAIDQDSVTAGELTQFKSTLKIGGDNLFTGTKTFNNQAAENSTSSFYPSYGGFGGNTQEFLPNALFGTHTVVKTSSSWCGFYLREADGVSWEAKEDMVLSFWANASADVYVYGIASQLGLVATITANQPMTKYEVLIPKGKPLRNASNQGIIEFHFPNGGELWYGAVMIQVGTKATSWQPSMADSEVDLSGYATADALTATDAKVEIIDGRVTSLASDTTILKSSMDVVSKYSLANKAQISTAHLDPDWYYPLMFQLHGVASPMRVYRNLDGVGPIPPWANHGAGFEVDIMWKAAGNGWGSRGIDRVVERATWSWEKDNTPPCLRIVQLSTSSQEVIYLRGGAFYHVEFGGSISGVALVEESYTNGGGETVVPVQWNPEWAIKTSLAEKAEASALNTLSTQVTTIDGRITSQASSIIQLQTDVAGNTAAIQVQGTVLDGIKAEYTIKLDVNGLVAGIGLLNDGARTAVAINADMFYVGSAANGKKPFMVLNTSQTIGGVTYPAGTWIDVALIANATIGSAHIANASITDAHIVSLNASKITAGIIDAERIGANSISVEKLMVGDATNLWGNQHFNPNGPLLGGSRTRIVTDMSELKGNGMQLWGRDHIAPYASKIPIKEGDTIVIEYIAGRNGGPDLGLHVGLWTYNINGNQGSAPWQMGPAEQIANLGNGWFRWRRIFVVTNHGHTLPVAYGALFFHIQQGDNEPDPAYWAVGDVTVRKGVGGELIVNGAVTADKIQVDSLSAISANLGTIITLKDPNKPLGVRTVQTGGLIMVYDENNVMRTRMGFW